MINADKKKEMKNLSEMLLETRNLTKQYGHHKAVDSVNMHIKKGIPVDDGFFFIFRQLPHTVPPHNRCLLSAHAACV